MPRQIRRSFAFERETENTYRFHELTEPQAGNGKAIGVLYIQKSALGSVPPQRITATIEVPDASDQAAS